MTQSALHSDYLVIGAGVIGLAIAKRLSDLDKECIVLEQHNHFAEETSSRNSEVIHAGIYYPQNTLKAKLCVSGKAALYDYCQQRSIPHSNTGKLIIACSDTDQNQLFAIQQNATSNGVTDLNLIDRDQLNKLEPQIQGTAALHSPSTGIIDSHQFMLSLVGDIEDKGNAIIYKAKVYDIKATQLAQTEQGWVVTLINQGEQLTITCRWLINAAGLHANALAQKYLPTTPNIHFCRGLYFNYSGTHNIKHLIYPVPEKNTIGLGIHATLDLAGQLKFGPDTRYLNQLDYHFPEGDELAKLKTQWLNAIQRYFPSVCADKLQPSYAGIRPKLSGANEPAQDFIIEGPKHHGLANLIQLLGIESPGLTASLAIGQYVTELIKDCEP